MVLLNFSGSLAINSFSYLKACLKAGGLKSNKVTFLIPNPFEINLKLKWFYLISAIVSSLFCVRLVYLMKTNLTPLSNAKQKGSRHFATITELKREYRSVPEKSEFFKGKGGFPISRYKDRIFIDDSPVNNLLIGTTRSGKDEIYAIPAIDIYSRPKRIIDRASIIISDPKGEQACASKEVLESRGYIVHIFDLIYFKGLSFNPLQLVIDAYLRGDKSEAQLITNTLSYILFHDSNAKDKTWENWSIALTNSLILAVTIDCCAKAEKCTDEKEKQKWYNKINMYSVARLLIDLGEPKDNKKSKIDKFFESRGLNDIARLQYASVAFATSKTKGNIFANTLSQLIKFTMDDIAKMTSKNTISLEDVGFNKEHPSAVFLVMPDYDTSNHFLVTMFISQLYYMLSKKSLTHGGKCTREVIFLLNEFGNIIPIPNMAHMLTVCTGRNIRFDLIVQGYSQIYKLYGEQDGKTIISNCGNQIYLLTIEEDTAKYISSIIGGKTITVFSRSEENNLSLDKKMSEHVDTQPLLNYNELMEFKPGESAVIRVTKRTDLNGRKIKPNPIYNHDETIMKYRYEYLADTFDTKKPYQSLNITESCKHKDVDLTEIAYTPGFENDNVLEEISIQKEPLICEYLSQEQLSQIIKFFELESFDTSSINVNITVTEFDKFLQELLDNEKISQHTFDDIYTVLENAENQIPERSENIEIET